MRKRKYILLALISVVLVASGLAATVEGFRTYEQGDRESLFERNQTIEFKLNATGSSNASISIFDPNGTLEIQESMNRSVSPGGQNYSYTFDTSNLSVNESGEWSSEATVQPNNDSIGTDFSEKLFNIFTDQPSFLYLTNQPYFVNPGENTTVEARIADSGEDLQGANISFPEMQNLSMNEVQKDGPVYEYEREVTIEDMDQSSYRVTSQDSAGRTISDRKQFAVGRPRGSSDVTVEVAPSCSSALNFFLVPGDGEIVQNKTGVFVEIVGNSGNVRSNISVDYIDVTYQNQDPYSRGDRKGPEIQSYPGESFSNVKVGSTVTYFELFQASYQKGNYTGFSQISTECQDQGPQDEERELENVEDDFNCTDTNSSNFSCFKTETLSVNLVDSEVDQANLSIKSNKSVSVQESGSEAYKTTITLNSTDYDAYVFNSTESFAYDYSCISENDSIYSEQEQCAFESNLVDIEDIEISSIGFDGSNATYTLKKPNPERLNTSLSCEDPSNADTTAICDTTFKFFERFSFFGNFEIVDAIGEKSGGVNESGNQSTNQTIPGNRSDVPGQTNVTVPEPDPVPEPEPEPEPVPDPVPEPVVRVDIESLEEDMSVRQGSFVAAPFEITNIGNVPIQDIQIRSLVDRIRGDWEVRNSQIENLSVNDTVEREVFIQPASDTEPGQYVIPVSAEKNSSALDLDYFTLNVKEADFVPRVSILEAPQQISVAAGTSTEIPVLVENDGRLPLENVTARMQNAEDCGTVSSTETDRIGLNESGSLQLDIEATDTTTTCETTLVVSTSGGAYAFSEVDLEVTPEAGLIPEEQRVPFIALIWTAVLAVYAYFTREYDLESLTVKGPFILLIAGEVLIMLYVAADYYGLASAGILPF